MRIIFTILAATLLFGNCRAMGGYKTSQAPPAINGDLQVPYIWKMLEYSFPSDAERQAAIANDNYVQINGLPIDVQPHYQSKL